MFKYKLYLTFVFGSLILACNTEDNTPLSIKFSNDSSAILFSNIDEASLLQLKNNINKDTAYQKLASVLETPAEDDSLTMEREWPGKLHMAGENLVFVPDSPFVKGKTYLVETYLNMSFGDVEQAIRSKLKTTIKFQQEILKR